MNLEAVNLRSLSLLSSLLDLPPPPPVVLLAKSAIASNGVLNNSSVRWIYFQLSQYCNLYCVLCELWHGFSFCDWVCAVYTCGREFRSNYSDNIEMRRFWATSQAVSPVGPAALLSIAVSSRRTSPAVVSSSAGNNVIQRRRGNKKAEHKFQPFFFYISSVKWPRCKITSSLRNPASSLCHLFPCN